MQRPRTAQPQFSVAQHQTSSSPAQHLLSSAVVADGGAGLNTKSCAVSLEAVQQTQRGLPALRMQRPKTAQPHAAAPVQHAAPEQRLLLSRASAAVAGSPEGVEALDQKLQTAQDLKSQTLSQTPPEASPQDWNHLAAAASGVPRPECLGQLAASSERLPQQAAEQGTSSMDAAAAAATASDTTGMQDSDQPLQTSWPQGLHAAPVQQNQPCNEADTMQLSFAVMQSESRLNTGQTRQSKTHLQGLRKSVGRNFTSAVKTGPLFSAKV